MSGTVAIVVAAGNSTRFGGATPKQFFELCGESVVSRAVRAMTQASRVDAAIVVLPKTDLGGPHDLRLRGIPKVLSVIGGGPTRMASVLAGVEAAEDATIVLVHDGARPFVAPDTVAAVLDGVQRHGAAIPALVARETVKRDDGGGFVEATLDRTVLRFAQTPQGARRDWMIEALRLVAASGEEVTDESQALERAGRRVALVAGDAGNVKITTLQDWHDARRRLEASDAGVRVGHGYDVHRFGGSRRLVLGGVAFPGESGLLGHSDADVVLHAAMDAVLGAAGLPDIGYHFPSDDPRYEGADSAELAREVADRVRHAGFRISNLDLTMLAERPMIRDRVVAMRESIAACFLIDRDRVGLKATTLEGMGALGRGEGIACHAVALLRCVGMRT
jgi:2-C-methyl-D-erythritol 4-phosphate cytidylyltransferase/2-C-methyl-D-erythritol 2,4-cyclodiphosphate synthase